MKCGNCGCTIKDTKQFCSKECSNNFRRNEKITKDMLIGGKFLSCDFSDFIKSLVNKKTGKLEPNKMTPHFFNNNYILPRYYEIFEKTKDYTALTFKERVHVLLQGVDGNKSVGDLVKKLVKKNGGIDFNKLTTHWLELNGFLVVSKQLVEIERSNLEKYLFLIENKKTKCLTCNGETTFTGFSKGYAQFCSTTCISSNNAIQAAKRKHKADKKLSSLFALDGITPLFDMTEYIGAGQGIKYNFKCNRCGSTFESRIANGHIPLCPTCDYKHFNGNSKMENELISILEKENVLEKSNRTVLNGKELDILIPDKKIAIEFNGIYWHSELNGKSKNYHLDKTLKCEEKEIQLLHIFENEWVEKKDIVLSIIDAKLGKFEKRFYARKCIVTEITITETDKFLETNHLQGKDKSWIKLGLFFDDELVAVMTFDNSRCDKKYHYELHRFCSKMGYQIIGGASKLFKYFKLHYSPESVITYVDRRYATGASYDHLGFTKGGISSPNYFYFKVGTTKLISKTQFQKHELKDMLVEFNPALTEWENMQINGFDRIWDCGNYVFEWTPKKE